MYFCSRQSPLSRIQVEPKHEPEFYEEIIQNPAAGVRWAPFSVAEAVPPGRKKAKTGCRNGRSAASFVPPGPIPSLLPTRRSGFSARCAGIPSDGWRATRSIPPPPSGTVKSASSSAPRTIRRRHRQTHFAHRPGRNRGRRDDAAAPRSGAFPGRRQSEGERVAGRLRGPARRHDRGRNLRHALHGVEPPYSAALRSDLARPGELDEARLRLREGL